ncbi:YbfB/YjiJ family MFS transporter [Dactylosporangium sp. NPDC049140]|uniref:YbfB/YjiJ family MFS transporter n=1 Tax=Dactylosporangium sp. NPDC049140 TaxID=3155647 RepID=UPI0033E3D550
MPLGRVAVAYALFAAGYLAYLTFLSAYLDSRHASAGLVAVVWTLLGLAVPAGLPLWGRMGLAGPLVVVALAALGAYLWPVPGVVVLSAAAYGAVFMAVPAAVTGIAKASAGPGRATVVVARLTVVFALGQAAGPWLAGLVADRTEPAAALLWTAGLCAVAAAAGATRAQAVTRTAG